MGPNKPRIGLLVITSQSEVEQAILAENQRRFTQAGSAPLLQEPPFSQVGTIDLTKLTECILQHAAFPLEFDTTGVEDSVLQLLPHLQRHPSVEDFSTPHDPNQCAAGWKKLKTATSASPFGWTFTQVKALTLDPRLLHVPATLAWAPFAHGLWPPEWEKVANVMLLKEHNDFCTPRSRAIGLLDVPHNHTSKNLGRSMMAHAENHEQIAIEQCGSRKNKACVDQSLNKVFTTDDWRVHQTCGIACSTDLQSCCDRMVLSATAMACRRWGAPIPALQSAFGPLSHAHTHVYVRTAHGDSSDFFAAAPDTPPHGVVQGNGMGPPSWGATSSPVFDVLRDRGHGVAMASPLTHSPVHCVCFAFVSDEDNATTGTTKCEATEKMQRFLHDLQGGYRFSGGQLVKDVTLVPSN